MSKIKITLADAKAELRDVATGPRSEHWSYAPAVKALLNSHDELLAILGEATVALEEKDQRIAELENDEVRQRLANAEHQLYMKDLAISNIKASRLAQFKKRREAEQRLQQPIKLPERYSVDCGVVCDPSGDWLSLDDVVKVLGDAGVEVRSPCPRCNRLLDLTSRPDGAHYCHHKVEGE